MRCPYPVGGSQERKQILGLVANIGKIEKFWKITSGQEAHFGGRFGPLDGENRQVAGRRPPYGVMRAGEHVKNMTGNIGQGWWPIETNK